VPFDSATEIDIQQFTPPAGVKHALRKQNDLIDMFSLEDIQRVLQALPPVPSPLLRYVIEGSSRSLSIGETKICPSAKHIFLSQLALAKPCSSISQREQFRGHLLVEDKVLFPTTSAQSAGRV
jgi:hypothetical protein